MRGLLRVLKDSVLGGIDIVQLRDKKGSAQEILHFCSKILKITKHKIPFIVNDRADLALLSGADGLHVGQEDLDCPLARRMMGQGKMVGVSCQTLELTRSKPRPKALTILVLVPCLRPKRNRTKADGFGILAKGIATVEIPVFPIGGISRDNIGRLAFPIGRDQSGRLQGYLSRRKKAVQASRVRKNLKGDRKILLGMRGSRKFFARG